MLDLVRVDIAKAPARLVDGDAERAVVLFEEVGGVVRDVPDLALSEDVPKAWMWSVVHLVTSEEDLTH